MKHHEKKLTFSAKRVSLLGVLAALALISFIVESLIPLPLIPGARIGLGNLFITLSLVWLTLPETLILLIVKCLVSAMFGSPVSIVYSLIGGLLSVTASYFMLKYLEEFLSHASMSVAAAIIHNLSQLVVFALVTRTAEVIFYAPYFIALGALAGALVGIITTLCLNLIKNPFGIIKTEHEQVGIIKTEHE